MAEYRCSVCGRTFADPDLYEQHMRVERGERAAEDDRAAEAGAGTAQVAGELEPDIVPAGDMGLQDTGVQGSGAMYSPDTEAPGINLTGGEEAEPVHRRIDSGDDLDTGSLQPDLPGTATLGDVEAEGTAPEVGDLQDADETAVRESLAGRSEPGSTSDGRSGESIGQDSSDEDDEEADWRRSA